MTRRLQPADGLAAILVLLAATPAFAQGGDAPVLSGVFPPGATVGREVDWAISGRGLGTARSLLIGGGGVEVVALQARGEDAATARVRVRPDATPGYREVRLDGPDGLSNPAIVRVDALDQVVEIEPNDDRMRAQAVAAGTAVAGVLGPLDLDHFRVAGTPGRRLTLDLEARRIGTSIAPVVTVWSPSGASIAQGRESRGGDRDCRMGITLPAEGWLLVQVRDNTYAGGDQARYRLRLDPAPFATALFPLGGPAGQAVEVEASGGNLAEARRKTIRLPDAPGTTVEVGAFDGPDGPIHPAGRLAIGDGPEVSEPAVRPGELAMPIAPGVTVNGRIGRAGEVDAYRLAVKAGDLARVRVEAVALGSWLDSVVTIRDEKGLTLAENDDADDAPAAGGRERSGDSAIDHEAKVDGVLTIEVADRFGDGGPEYGYRLGVGPPRADFAVTLLPGDVDARAIARFNRTRADRTSPGRAGVFNLKPGATAAVNFLITPRGRPGPVELRVVGLPDGVTADPVKVRVGGPPSPGPRVATPTDAAALADSILLKVGPTARPGLSEFRVVATARPEPERVLTREATAKVGIDAPGASGRPISRVIGRFPLRILGDPGPVSGGPPAPPAIR